MKSTPLLFKPEMIRACIDGRKRMTRRLVKPQPALSATSMPERFPYGKVGDEIWAKETWTVETNGTDAADEYARVTYAADGHQRFFSYNSVPGDWTIPNAAIRGNVSPLFMPRWASRFARTLTRVRVERLQSITEDDARAEGIQAWIDSFKLGEFYHENSKLDCYPVTAFARLWDSINRDRAPWSSNPWVWVLEW